jgi:hypothetical protein
MGWFDASTIDPSTGTGNFPVGRHPAVIKGSTQAATKDGSGGMLVFTVEIYDGQYKGVSSVYRLNMWNSSPQSAEIATKQLSALCHVVGVKDLIAEPKGVELFGKPFFIIVEQQPAPNDKYTQIVGVQDIRGNAPVKGMFAGGQPQQGQQQPQQGQPTHTQQPSWGGAPTGQQPQQQPQQAQPAQPSWGAPQAGQPPQQAAAQQPSWAQQPATGAAPPWGNR